jgi:hypothetical protein
MNAIDLQSAIEMNGAQLNTLSPQSEIAHSVLEMLKAVSLNDKEYIERIKRHYKLFRSKIDGVPQRQERADRKKTQPKIPKAMQEIQDEIAPLIRDFCTKHLNDEYLGVCMLMLEKLCRKRPSPLLRGKLNTWACGIIYVIGPNNFLFDKTQTPHMRASDLAGMFGISSSTAGNKAGEIRRIFKIGVFEPEWTLPSKLGYNPYVWMFETQNGFILDARYASREVQEELYYAGKIPYIPLDRSTQMVGTEDDAEGPNIPEKPAATVTLKTKEKIELDGQLSFDDEL